MDTLQETHQIRITTHGKMRHWVDSALDFLDKNEDRPITFHTLPLAKPIEPLNGEGTLGEGSTNPKPKPSKSSSCSLIIPRLISVVEIIKREHLKRLQAERSTQLYGVHQYNEVGCLEDLESDSEQQIPDLMDVLSGKNVKIKRSVYMKITLCRKKLQHLVDQGATYQAPLVRQLSKSARRRAKKKSQKADEKCKEVASEVSS